MVDSRLLELLGVTVIEAEHPTPWPTLWVPSHRVLVVSPEADAEDRRQAVDYVLSVLWDLQQQESA